MLGRRRTGGGMPAEVDTYGQHAADAESIYNPDGPEPPATSYASAKTPLNSRYAEPTMSPKMNAAYVDRRPRMNGLAYNMSWGGVDMGAQCASLPGDASGGGLNGFVRSSMFQRTLVQLHDWQTNAAWYTCWNGTGSGMFWGSKPQRYDYPSFRVAQPDTSITGGAGRPSMRMNRTPRFTSVQSIQKYTVNPTRYNTRGTNS